MEGKVLSGQVAVVVGASVGIGAAICKELAKAGARVVMGARRTEKMQEVKLAIEKNGGQAEHRRTDVTVRQESEPGCTVYTGSKFFVEGVVRGLRREVSMHNVRVTSVQPGEVDTEIFTYSKTDPEAEELYGTFPSKFKILEPIDVAKAVVYAVSQPDHVAVNELLIQPKDSPISY